MSEQKNKSWKNSLKNRKYDEHKHCVVCSRAIPIDRDFCSSECKDIYSNADKKKGKKSTVQIVFLIAFMLIMITVVIPALTGSK